MTRILASIPRRRRALIGAALLYALVFALRLAAPDPTDGLAILYVLPVILVALEYGRWGGWRQQSSPSRCSGPGSVSPARTWAWSPT